MKGQDHQAVSKNFSEALEGVIPEDESQPSTTKIETMERSHPKLKKGKPHVTSPVTLEVLIDIP